MQSKRVTGPITNATVGFAADEDGHGVAYVALATDSLEQSLRIPFTVRRYPALRQREIGYAAMTAAAERVAEMGCRRVVFHVDDERLVDDVCERRDVPMPLAIEYVRLGCALNRFADYKLALNGESGRDLRARALAEVTLRVAA